MEFTQLDIVGAFLVEAESHPDERGSFDRAFCQREFLARGLNPWVAQCNISMNRKKGTLRGLHSQPSPHQEDKLVRCTRGSIYDVIVDLRPDSESYRQHLGIELTPESGQALFIPKGVFHGFVTLDENTDVFYQMSVPYVATPGLGIRWNDPAFGIEWPVEVNVISDRDASYPDFDLEPRLIQCV